MRRWLMALGVACAVGGSARAQLGSPGATNDLPAAMPGQVVGTTLPLQPAGTPISRAVPSRADLKKLETPQMRLYDPTKPYDALKQANLLPSDVAAPIAAFPNTAQDQTLFDRLGQKLSSVTHFFTPGAPPRPTYTPGLSRRNKERAMERMWRRD